MGEGGAAEDATQPRVERNAVYDDADSDGETDSRWEQRSVAALEFRWCSRVVETVSGEDDGECSGEPRTVRVVGTIDRPNRT